MKPTLLILLSLFIFVCNTVGLTQSDSQFILYSDQNNDPTSFYLSQFPPDSQKVIKFTPAWLKGDLLAWAYAPSTKNLIFQDSSNFDIYSLQLGNSNPKSVLVDQNPNSLYLLQDWSPDGDHLLLTLNQSKEYGENSLVVYDLDGGFQALTKVYSSLEFPIEQARWSPDGKTIVMSARDEQTGPSDIFLISTSCLNENTSRLCSLEPFQTVDIPRQMTEAPDGSSQREDWNSPTWSPDSVSLAFFCGEDICKVNRAGTDLKRISSVKGDNLNWGLDTRYITYNHGGEIYVMDLQTNEITNITNTAKIREYFPLWVDLKPSDFLPAVSEASVTQ